MKHLTDRELYDLLVKYNNEGKFKNPLIQPGMYYSAETECRCPIIHVLLCEGLIEQKSLPDDEYIINYIRPNYAHVFEGVYDQFGNITDALEAYGAEVREQERKMILQDYFHITKEYVPND